MSKKSAPAPRENPKYEPKASSSSATYVLAGIGDMVCRMGDELRADDGDGNWVRLLRNGDRVTVLAWDQDDAPLDPALAGAAVNSWSPRPLPVEPGADRLVCVPPPAFRRPRPVVCGLSTVFTSPLH